MKGGEIHSQHDPQLMPLQTLLVQIGIVGDHAISSLHVRIVVDSLLIDGPGQPLVTNLQRN